MDRILNSEREMVIRLDQDLASFFSYIDKKDWLGECDGRGVASARLDLDALTEAIDDSLNARFSPNKGVQYFMPSTQELPYLALDPRAFGTV